MSPELLQDSQVGLDHINKRIAERDSSEEELEILERMLNRADALLRREIGRVMNDKEMIMIADLLFDILDRDSPPTLH